ncbi:hypothetical protein [Actinoplanes sp. NPDC020271]|uniref:hypothetical protein n=1 Tax=Actinoplanes sp. NPDC020271 TaxID=3363896 RepID=UPI00379ACB4C
MSTRDTERQRARANNLQRNADRYRDATLALRQVYSEGRRQRARLLIRRSLVRRAVGWETAHGPTASPASALITQKGWALHLYLIAIFEAQTRTATGAESRNTRPLYTTGEQRGWADLLPAVTATKNTAAGMRRQLTRALTQLARHNLIELAGKSGLPDRYEGFRLRNEAGTAYEVWNPGDWTPGRYSVPATDDNESPDPFRPPAAKDGQVETISLPASFVLQGWVHVLSAAEILTYLMLRDLETRYPDSSKRGVFVTEPNRISWYAVTRDVYESHRQLAAFGLIEHLPDPNRRADGSILRRPGGRTRLEPLRFRTLPEGLEQPAVRTVISAISTN